MEALSQKCVICTGCCKCKPSVSYKDANNGAGWTLTMRSDDELNDKQIDYYHKLLDLLLSAEGQ